MSQTQIAPDPPGTESQDSEKGKSDSSRDYIVLESSDLASWRIVKEINASSAESAIRALGSTLKEGQHYVAVPQRNWRPATPKIETKTTIALRLE